MTYTFDPALGDDVSLVRFHTGDNNAKGSYMADETIQYLVTQHGVGGAVVKSIQYIITQLSQPNFSQGWMSVSRDAARAGYERLLPQKAQEFGISISNATATSSVKNASRGDSYQTSNVYDGAP